MTEKIMKLAKDITEFTRDYDGWAFNDYLYETNKTEQEYTEELYTNIINKKPDGVVPWLKDIIKYDEDLSEAALSLLARLSAYI